MVQGQDTLHLRSGLFSRGPLTFGTHQGHRHGHTVLTCSSATATAVCSAGSCRGRGANTWTPKSRDAEAAGWAAPRLKWLRSRRGRLFSLAGAAALAAAARLRAMFTLLPRGDLPWLPALCGLQAHDHLSYQCMAAFCPALNSKHLRVVSAACMNLLQCTRAAHTALLDDVPHHDPSYTREGGGAVSLQSMLPPLSGLECTRQSEGSSPTMLLSLIIKQLGYNLPLPCPSNSCPPG